MFSLLPMTGHMTLPVIGVTYKRPVRETMTTRLTSPVVNGWRVP